MSGTQLFFQTYSVNIRLGVDREISGIWAWVLEKS